MPGDRIEAARRFLDSHTLSFLALDDERQELARIIVAYAAASRKVASDTAPDHQLIADLLEVIDRSHGHRHVEAAERAREAGRIAGLHEAAMIAQIYGVPGGHIADTGRAIAKAIRTRAALADAPSPNPEPSHV